MVLAVAGMVKSRAHEKPTTDAARPRGMDRGRRLGGVVRKSVGYKLAHKKTHGQHRSGADASNAVGVGTPLRKYRPTTVSRLGEHTPADAVCPDCPDQRKDDRAEYRSDAVAVFNDPALMDRGKHPMDDLRLWA